MLFITLETNQLYTRNNKKILFMIGLMALVAIITLIPVMLDPTIPQNSDCSVPGAGWGSLIQNVFTLIKIIEKWI